MPLQIYQNATAIAPNLSMPFAANGGVPPYNYFVVPGGAGGTIDSATGQYTAPFRTGRTDTIKVVDSIASVAFAEVIVGTPEMLLCDIIQTQLNLSQGQVYLWDQKINIPEVFQMYVILRTLRCRPFGNTNYYDGENTIQSTNFLSVVTIDILSRGTEARDRKEEVVMALRSDYAEQQQEMNSFFIGSIPTDFIDLSQEDGAAIPYRFNISVMIQYFVSKTVPVSYYDSFQSVDVVPNP